MDNKDNVDGDTDTEPMSFNQKQAEPNYLNIEKILDRMETASVASFRSKSGVSIKSEESILELEKKQHFSDFFTMVMSISYGLFLIIISITCYASDLVFFHAYQHHMTEIWNLLVSCVGILLLLWLIIDIHNYIRTINRMAESSSTFGAGFKLIEAPDGEFHIEIPMVQGQKKNIPEYYGFTTGRHAGSFFLKIGAALFCFGHLIHMGLNFVKTLVLVQNEDIQAVCSTNEILAQDIIYPLFSLVQLFFIFKYGNVIVNKNKWLARFTFMHCLCSSLSFWVNTVIQETLDAFVKKYFTEKVICYEGIFTTTEEPDDFSSGSTVEFSDLKTAELRPCNETQDEIFNNIICVIETRATCSIGDQLDDQISDIFSVAPWFYPFSIEFNILIVAIWYILWSSIGKIDDHKHSLEFFPSVTPQGSTENLHRTAGHKEAQIVFADCSSSNTGMFFGATMMVIVIVCSLFVLLTEGSCDNNAAITVGNSLQISVLSILTLATLYAYYSITRFDVNPNPISFLDDLLLFFCLPSFFLYAAICFAPLLLDSKFEVDFFFRNLLMLVQVLIQTPMIVDGLRRCSNTAAAQKRMRGRNTITFLIVANLAVYIMETLLIRSYDYQENKIEFYGPDMWTVLSHMTLPICIFYRFHSAVALVDIWTSAYKPSHSH